MISAFGIDHNEISKGLKPANVAALKRVVNSGANLRDKGYAEGKLVARSGDKGAWGMRPMHNGGRGILQDPGTYMKQLSGKVDAKRFGAARPALKNRLP